VRAGRRSGRATLHVFDLLEVDGEDVRGLPYRERLARLSALLRAEADPAVAVVMTAYCAATKRRCSRRCGDAVARGS